MSEALPPYYFRIRENGASVFRVESDPRNRRMDLREIAVVVVKNGNIKPHGDITLTPEDRAAIQGWLDQRQAELARREAEEIERTIDQINLTAQWVQSRASDEAIEALSDRLLLAMHDLRSVIVRRKAEAL